MRSNLQLVVMGVSGCGKSTVSQAIGEKLGLQVADGDDFHSAENRAKMQAGIALEDADRWPWLDRIANYLAIHTSDALAGKVVACSALKLAYRNQIRATVPHALFIFLDGSRELIHERMAKRQGHFMQLSLLDSQLRTLEKPMRQEKDVFAINIDTSIESIVTQIVSALALRQASASFVLNDKDTSKLHTVVEHLRCEGFNAEATAFDVNDASAAQLNVDTNKNPHL